MSRKDTFSPFYPDSISDRNLKVMWSNSPISEMRLKPSTKSQIVDLVSFFYP
jgi:hypothetical protein